jgi:signal transduction histidine kinase
MKQLKGLQSGMYKLCVYIFNVFSYLTFPRSANKDLARREYILHVLLLGSILLSSIAASSALISQLLGTSPKGSSIEVFILLGIFLLGYYVSRTGKSRWVAYLMISLYLIITSYSSYRWGGDVPEDLLIYSFIIVMSGILINSLAAFVVSAVSSFVLLCIIYLQSTHAITVSSSWRSKPPILGDAIVYSITLFFIALVSWLFNRETEKALRRARVSESALEKQNDQLEGLIEARTRELKQVQAEKLAQLYRFSEFGKMTSGLFHDLVNPLELITLNLDRLSEGNKKMDRQEIKKLLHRAIIGTKQLEGFVRTARKQMRNQEILQFFSLKDEITQVIQILTYKAKKAHITVMFSKTRDIHLFGSAIKFDQLITNLLTNAIDAYDADTNNNRQVEIHMKKDNKYMQLTVQDWGSGIKKRHISKVFDPLFTTKSFEKGTGIGLTICRDIVEKDFKGTIEVKSEENIGTTFTIVLPVQKM